MEFNGIEMLERQHRTASKVSTHNSHRQRMDTLLSIDGQYILKD